MREFLFRGKMIDYEGYAYGSLIIEKHWVDMKCTKTYNNNAEFVYIFNDFKVRVDPDTVGMKVAECNGENLFENQRVMVGRDEPYPAIIKWCDECQSVQLFTEDGEDCYNHKHCECDWNSFIQYCIDGLVRSAE